MAELCLGIARARLGPAAALIDSENGIAACEENRITRGRQAPTSGPPEQAIAELLAYRGREAADIAKLSVVHDVNHPGWWHGEWWEGERNPPFVEVSSLQGHAKYAFASSGFDDALAVECDAKCGYTAVRSGHATLEPAVGQFPIAAIYSSFAEALGLHPHREEHLVEAMARAGDARRSKAGELISIGDDGLRTPANFVQAVYEACDERRNEQARRDVAAALQEKLGFALQQLLARLAKQSGARRACLFGGLFFNTYFTTTAATSGVFEETFVPPHPGVNGAAVGAAMLGANAAPRGVGSPYLGPGYTDPQIKAALENCKLSFDLQREDQVIDTVLRALSRGRLVGWFHGRLEWGPRALGHRTVLADPFSPHVLDNLNGYLKKRPTYRTYGLSVPAARVQELFAGPPASPFMQYEYQPRDPEKFRALLPEGVHTLRVHTVDESEPRYLRLLERWGEMSGMPVLVNTSFNGFHEPLVCSPRDAIRVFYGTGLDLLALEDFILRK